MTLRRQILRVMDCVLMLSLCATTLGEDATLPKTPSKPGTANMAAVTTPALGAATDGRIGTSAFPLSSAGHLLVQVTAGDTNIFRTARLLVPQGATQVFFAHDQLATADGRFAFPEHALVLNSNTVATLATEGGKPIYLPIQIDVDGVHSGEYIGDIYTWGTNFSSPIQLTIRLKDRPCWTIIVLLVSIGLSVVLSRYREGGRQHDLLVLQASRFEQILVSDSEFQNAPEFKDSISQKLDQTRIQLDTGRYPDATNTLQAISKSIDLWLQYKQIWLALFGDWKRLRSLAVASQDAAVVGSLGLARAAVQGAADAPNPAALQVALQALATALNAPQAGGAALGFQQGKALRFTPWEVKRAAFATVAYLYATYAIMIALFCLVGYSQLYDAKPTFGANGLMDYFTIVLWGFGVETTTRTSLTSATKTWGIPGFN
jgi:hypothetical protein